MKTTMVEWIDASQNLNGNCILKLKEKKNTEWKWKKKLFKNHFKANRTCDGSCARNPFEHHHVMIGQIIGL